MYRKTFYSPIFRSVEMLAESSLNGICPHFITRVTGAFAFIQRLELSSSFFFFFRKELNFLFVSAIASISTVSGLFGVLLAP